MCAYELAEYEGRGVGLCHVKQDWHGDVVCMYNLAQKHECPSVALPGIGFGCSAKKGKN